MSTLELPERASLDYLKRRAKERLAELRAHDPDAKLADAQLAIARDHGFASWRALKAELDRRREPAIAAYFAACEAGDTAALRALLDRERALVAERRRGETGLHAAVRHLDAVRLLLERGADPDARDDSDHATALHRAGFAASGTAIVRALLDAGGDVHGEGDAHRVGVIGWHTCYQPAIDRDAVALLLEHGARHHAFSAIACGDRAALHRLVEDDPSALARRLAPFESAQTPLHYVIAPPDGLIGGGFRTGAHYPTLDLLLELGADVEAEDGAGRTPLAIAMLRGDREAMHRLQAAGARVPPGRAGGGIDLAALARTVTRVDAMLRVRDVPATVAWYRAIGFEVYGEHALDTSEAWAGLALGDARVMVVPGVEPSARRDVSLWFRTPHVEDLHRALKQRQLDRAAAVLAGGDPPAFEVRFVRDLHETFYGQREFSIADPDDYELTFCWTN